jgi:uncharacterized protein (DUF488 family)
MPNGALVSIGYQGRTIDEFVETLRRDGVTAVVDVRLTPFSRKPGFSKTKLRDALAAAGIEYVHEPTLGNPKDNRDAFRAGRPSAHERYRAHILRGGEEAIERLIVRAKRQRTAVLCLERSRRECHRAEVLAVVNERAPDIGVTYLGEDPPSPATDP